MQITYKNKRIMNICNNAYEAEKKHGKRMAGIIQQRIAEIMAADSVELLVQFRIGRCHALSGNRKNQFAMDLVHPYRLVFKKKENKIQIAHILEITDYH